MLHYMLLSMIICGTPLVATFFGLVYMCPQFLLFLPQGAPLLAAYGTTADDHHDRLISSLFAIGGAAR